MTVPTQYNYDQARIDLKKEFPSIKFDSLGTPMTIPENCKIISERWNILVESHPIT